MLSAYTKVHSLLTTMLVTGIIIDPAALATPAVQDLVNLRFVVNAAANIIGDQQNPNRGWGIGFGGGSGMGTADLVNNITSTVLQMKFQVDTNKTAWLLPNNVTAANLNTTTLTPPKPTLPLTSSIAMPSTLPTALSNATTDLSTPYIDYVSAIPNLSTSLVSLGRAFHREMNTPVNQAIDALQQSLTTVQTTMLQSNLIGSQAILRTIRASSSLENAKTAWGRFLNLPGGTAGDDSGDTDAGGLGIKKRVVRLGEGGESKAKRPPPTSGTYYTHDELWGRDELRPKTSKERKTKWSNEVVQWEERRVRLANNSAENGRIGRPFVV